MIRLIRSIFPINKKFISTTTINDTLYSNTCKLKLKYPTLISVDKLASEIVSYENLNTIADVKMIPDTDKIILMSEFDKKSEWIIKCLNIPTNIGLSEKTIYILKKWYIYNHKISENCYLTLLCYLKYINNVKLSTIHEDSDEQKLRVARDVSKINILKYTKHMDEDIELENDIQKNVTNIKQIACQFYELEDFSFIRDNSSTATRFSNMNKYNWNFYVESCIVDRGIGWNTLNVKDAEYYENMDCLEYVKHVNKK